MEFKRGGVYLIGKNSSSSRYPSGSFAVIVSHDEINKRRDEVSVVFLSKRLLPTETASLAVKLESTGSPSYAICRKVASVGIDYVSEFICTLTADEMERIDQALILSVGLKKCVTAESQAHCDENALLKQDNAKLQQRIAELEAEIATLKSGATPSHDLQVRYDLLQQMYNSLVSQVLQIKGGFRC